MLIFVYSALIVVFDQFFKHWVILTLDYRESSVLIPGIFSLERFHNEGAAFGFMAGLPWWGLAAIQLAASIVIIMFILRFTEGFWGSLGLASVLGGAVGNLVDRVIHQHVVDMFRFDFLGDFFPFVFNLADVFITLGFLMFLIHFIAYTFKSDNKKALADGEEMRDDDYDQGVVMGEYAFDAAPVAPVAPAAPVSPVSPFATAQPDYEPLVQTDPVVVYDAPTSEIAPPVAQAVPQHIPQAIPQPLPQAQQIPQAMPQPIPQAIPQPLPQQALPVAQPIEPPVAQQVTPPVVAQPPTTPPIAQPLPQAVPVQDEDLSGHVDPAAIFGASNLEEAPLLEPASQTGPLPTAEIAPLLDHVYGGQYIAKIQESATPTPTAPVAAPTAPAEPAIVPVAEPASTAPPVPVAQPAPTAPPVPTPQPAPTPPPVAPTTPPTSAVSPIPIPIPVARPAPTAQPAPAVSPTPSAQPAPEAQLAPAQPTPVAPSQDEAPQAEAPQAESHPEAMLDALTALESELLGEESLEDYDADILLGEYGFESEDN